MATPVRFFRREDVRADGEVGIWLLAAGAGLALAAFWLERRRKRFDLDGASVVITGGSRGLGLELARVFARRGARLTLLARDADELERARGDLAARGADVLVYACDVGDAEQARRAVQFVIEHRGRIDVLVNNAGVIQVGPVEHMDQEDFEEAMAVHAWGPLYLMRAAAPEMKQQGRGRIVNISSIGGLVAVPHLLPYTMSKFALTGLSDGLRAEWAREGIRVTTVCPGLMRTGSHVNALFKGQHRSFWFALASSSPLITIQSRRAAKKIVAACRRGTARLIITPQARILHALNALAPGMTAGVVNLAARLLPDPAHDAEGRHRRPGWASRSSVAPSFLTRLSDKAALRNNELAGEQNAYRHELNA